MLNQADAAIPEKWLWFSHALLDGRWARDVRVGISRGRIASLAADVRPQAGDGLSGIAIPGIANVHSHAFQRALAGLTETGDASGNSFWTWREVMYRFVDRLTPDQFEAITAFAHMEMLESGFTRAGEFHYLHHHIDGSHYENPAEMAERIVAASTDAGIRLTLLPVLYNRAGFGGAPARAAQRRFINDPDGFARLFDRADAMLRSVPGAILGIAAHSLRAVTPEELGLTWRLRAEVPFHIHIAEQRAEVDDCLAWSGARPVRWLLDHAPVDARWCLVHATHVDDDELAGIARTGAVVGLCPITEANLGDGLFPAGHFSRIEGRYGIGSDSNVRIDAAQELNLLEYGQRLRDQKRNVLALEPGRSTGRALFDRATEDGARALGAASPKLGLGEFADIVALDARDPAMVARTGDAFLDSWIMVGHRELVRDVWVGGHQVVSGGRHLKREAIQSRFADVMRTVLES